MGGALALGNITPAAEFNVHVDPHAAAIVFGVGRPIVMFGLGVTHQAIASHEQVARLLTFGNATGRAVHGMLTRPRPGGLGTSRPPDARPLRDRLPALAGAVFGPRLPSSRSRLATVPCAGRTTIDWNGRLKRPANAHVVASVEAEALFERMFDRLATLP
jgi:purine nucleosidase